MQEIGALNTEEDDELNTVKANNEKPRTTGGFGGTIIKKSNINLESKPY